MVVEFCVGADWGSYIQNHGRAARQGAHVRFLVVSRGSTFTLSHRFQIEKFLKILKDVKETMDELSGIIGGAEVFLAKKHGYSSN